MRVLRAIVCSVQHSVAHSGRQCKNFFEGMRWFLGGFLACILAGAAMSIQGVMNTRLGGHIGTLETNAFVQCTAAVLSLLVLLFWRTGSFAALSAAPKYCKRCNCRSISPPQACWTR